MDEGQQELLDRYVDAFERYDIEALIELIYEDATMSMPPFDHWLRGKHDIAAWFVGPGAECAGSRVVRTVANGSPAYAQYRQDPAGGHRAWALGVLEIVDGRIAGINSFLDVERLFPLFDLPLRLD